MNTNENDPEKEFNIEPDRKLPEPLSEQLLKQCRKRDRSGQKKLYQLFYAYGMSITLRYSDSRDEAATILNDAFLKVFENIRKYDTSRPFKPWFRRILINTAINHYHKTKKYTDSFEFDLEDNTHFTDEKITGALGYDEIIRMVSKLPPSYRTVFNLIVIEGFSHSETARLLDISTGTTKSNLARARKILRVNLEKIFDM